MSLFTNVFYDNLRIGDSECIRVVALNEAEHFSRNVQIIVD